MLLGQHLNYQFSTVQNPESSDKKVKAVASILKDTDLIMISALLERMEMAWDNVHEVDEMKKSEIKKVNTITSGVNLHC